MCLGIRDWVVLKTGNGTSISMIRLCPDVSDICSHGSLMHDVILDQYLS